MSDALPCSDPATPLKIGLAGPILTTAFAPYLDTPDPAVVRPTGLGGTPLNMLAVELLKRGHQVTLFSLSRDVGQEVVLTGPNLKIIYGPYRQRARDRILDLFRNERAFLQRAMQGEVLDILHAHWTYEFAWPALDAGRPCLVTAHDAPLTILRHSFDAYRLGRTLMAWRILRRVANLAVVSPYVAAHLKRYRLYRADSAVIPNGIASSLFDSPAPPQVRTGCTFATVLNGWGHYKNGQAAIKAFALTRKNLPQARLMMFGSGHGPHEAAAQWASQQGLAEGIDFIGEIAHASLLLRLKQDVDVLVHPSLEESHGVALIEAMACGIPVIGGMDSGAVPDTLNHGYAGLLRDVRDPADLAEAMTGLGRNPVARRVLGEVGWAFASEHFRIEQIAARHLALYRTIIATEHARHESPSHA